MARVELIINGEVATDTHVDTVKGAKARAKYYVSATYRKAAEIELPADIEAKVYSESGTCVFHVFGEENES